MTNSKKLARTEARTENSNHAKPVKSAHKGDVKNKEVVSLNTVNQDRGIEKINNTVGTRDIILRVKTYILSRLKSGANRAA